MNKPKISVIMGIYNCADTLDEALESIISQTYNNWNVIMCDDGSVDKTYHVANKYVNKYPDKFILIKNEKNLGLNYTLNHCLEYADGDFIARMDGDDISLPYRFEKEVDFLLNNPKYHIVSCQMEYFDETGIFGISRTKAYPQPVDLVFGTIFCHAPCMVRKEAFDTVCGYTIDNKYLRVEDYELWVKMYANGYKGYNLPDVLYKMRDNRNAIKRRKFKYRVNEFYVKCAAIKRLKLSKRYYIYSIKPILIGLLPTCIYTILHKNNLK